ncbi:hypothetical protein SCAR479_10021 [Seiridium cardinale]|uniref:Uncharacterized protein n=1 Tax=Seiridium cardinale TaxID=138064 RepID=A0ABR2XHP7_9PEZI
MPNQGEQANQGQQQTEEQQLTLREQGVMLLEVRKELTKHQKALEKEITELLEEEYEQKILVVVSKIRPYAIEAEINGFIGPSNKRDFYVLEDIKAILAYYLGDEYAKHVVCSFADPGPVKQYGDARLWQRK